MKPKAELRRPVPGGDARAPFSVEEIRARFPILGRKVHGKPLTYLDNASTTQKPREVLEAVDRYYRHNNSNVHRGVHTLSLEATSAYEGARSRVRTFLGAPDGHEAVFVRGTTEAINLVATSWGGANLCPGDQVLLTEMEHHSDIVPWQIVCERTGASLQVVPVDDRGQLRLEELERLIGERTKIVCVVHVSNALGTVNPVSRIVERAHEHGVRVLVDGAQAVPHLPVDLKRLGADFYAFSGHKVFGPTGIGALVARRDLLEAMPPYQGGGDMIKSVSFERTVYNDVPYKFEAGTPDVAGAVGLAAAFDFLEGIGMERVAAHEDRLLERAREGLEAAGARLVGAAERRVGVVSFVMEGVHPHDIGTILDMEGIAIRTGHHCTEPLMRRFGVPGTARASFALYNTEREADVLVGALQRVREVFG